MDRTELIDRLDLDDNLIGHDQTALEHVLSSSPGPSSRWTVMQQPIVL